MIIESSDGKRFIDIGSYEMFHALYSTIKVRLVNRESEIARVLLFFEKEICQSEYALETARQFNLVRDYLSEVKPNDLIYDCNNMDEKNPWENKMSYIITSCSNFFLTADGKDLLFEIVSILTYSHYSKSDILIRTE